MYFLALLLATTLAAASPVDAPKKRSSKSLSIPTPSISLPSFSIPTAFTIKTTIAETFTFDSSVFDKTFTIETTISFPSSLAFPTPSVSIPTSFDFPSFTFPSVSIPEPTLPTTFAIGTKLPKTTEV